MYLYIYWMSWIVIPTLSVENCGHPFQMKTKNLNKRLTGYKLFERKVSAHHECATECMFLGACQSINYDVRNKTCELNSEWNEAVSPFEFVQSKGTIYSDIIDWPKSMAGGCASNTCGYTQRCFPLGNDAYKCADILCDNPSNTQYGIAQSGSNIAGSVRTFVVTCPEGMFGKGDKSVTCLLNGEWSSLAVDCTEITHGASCASSEDCKETGSECIVGNCFCGRFYRYSQDMMDCVKVCSSMADTFTLHASTLITLYNDIPGANGATEQECRQLCLDDQNCLSFEYGPSNNKIICRGSFVSIEMIEDAMPEEISVATFDVYNRDCT